MIPNLWHPTVFSHNGKQREIFFHLPSHVYILSLPIHVYIYIFHDSVWTGISNLIKKKKKESP